MTTDTKRAARRGGLRLARGAHSQHTERSCPRSEHRVRARPPGISRRRSRPLAAGQCVRRGERPTCTCETRCTSLCRTEAGSEPCPRPPSLSPRRKTFTTRARSYESKTHHREVVWLAHIGSLDRRTLAGDFPLAPGPSAAETAGIRGIPRNLFVLVALVGWMACCGAARGNHAQVSPRRRV